MKLAVTSLTLTCQIGRERVHRADHTIRQQPSQRLLQYHTHSRAWAACLTPFLPLRLLLPTPITHLLQLPMGAPPLQEEDCTLTSNTCSLHSPLIRAVVPMVHLPATARALLLLAWAALGTSVTTGVTAWVALAQGQVATVHSRQERSTTASRAAQEQATMALRDGAAMTTDALLLLITALVLVAHLRTRRPVPQVACTTTGVAGKHQVAVGWRHQEEATLVVVYLCPLRVWAAVVAGTAVTIAAARAL